MTIYIVTLNLSNDYSGGLIATKNYAFKSEEKAIDLMYKLESDIEDLCEIGGENSTYEGIKIDLENEHFEVTFNETELI